MAFCKPKTKYLAELSIVGFLRRHGMKSVYYGTFTEPSRELSGVYWTKTEAEARLKPFLDRLRRYGCEFLVFWERQGRGAWHPHILWSQKYFHIGGVGQGGLRDWMMKRGWGVQMKIKFVDVPAALYQPEKSYGFQPKHRDGALEAWRLVRYLCQYLSKSFTDADEPRKKLFCGSAVAKCGTVRFKWTADVEPSAMFYYYGAQWWRQMYGFPPKWNETQDACRVGFELCNWAAVDPWHRWAPSG